MKSIFNTNFPKDVKNVEVLNQDKIREISIGLNESLRRDKKEDAHINFLLQSIRQKEKGKKIFSEVIQTKKKTTTNYDDINLNTYDLQKINTKLLCFGSPDDWPDDKDKHFLEYIKNTNNIYEDDNNISISLIDEIKKETENGMASKIENEEITKEITKELNKNRFYTTIFGTIFIVSSIVVMCNTPLVGFYAQLIVSKLGLSVEVGTLVNYINQQKLNIVLQFFGTTKKIVKHVYQGDDVKTTFRDVSADVITSSSQLIFGFLFQENFSHFIRKFLKSQGRTELYDDGGNIILANIMSKFSDNIKSFVGNTATSMISMRMNQLTIEQVDLWVRPKLMVQQTKHRDDFMKEIYKINNPDDNWTIINGKYQQLKDFAMTKFKQNSKIVQVLCILLFSGFITEIILKGSVNLLSESWNYMLKDSYFKNIWIVDNIFSKEMIVNNINLMYFKPIIMEALREAIPLKQYLLKQIEKTEKNKINKKKIVNSIVYEIIWNKTFSNVVKQITGLALDVIEHDLATILMSSTTNIININKSQSKFNTGDKTPEDGVQENTEGHGNADDDDKGTDKREETKENGISYMGIYERFMKNTRHIFDSLLKQSGINYEYFKKYPSKGYLCVLNSLKKFNVEFRNEFFFYIGVSKTEINDQAKLDEIIADKQGLIDKHYYVFNENKVKLQEQEKKLESVNQKIQQTIGKETHFLNEDDLKVLDDFFIKYKTNKFKGTKLLDLYLKNENILNHHQKPQAVFDWGVELDKYSSIVNEQPIDYNAIDDVILKLVEKKKFLKLFKDSFDGCENLTLDSFKNLNSESIQQINETLKILQNSIYDKTKIKQEELKARIRSLNGEDSELQCGDRMTCKSKLDSLLKEVNDVVVDDSNSSNPNDVNNLLKILIKGKITDKNLEIELNKIENTSNLIIKNNLKLNEIEKDFLKLLPILKKAKQQQQKIKLLFDADHDFRDFMINQYGENVKEIIGHIYASRKVTPPEEFDLIDTIYENYNKLHSHENTRKTKLEELLKKNQKSMDNNSLSIGLASNLTEDNISPVLDELNIELNTNRQHIKTSHDEIKKTLENDILSEIFGNDLEKLQLLEMNDDVERKISLDNKSINDHKATQEKIQTKNIDINIKIDTIHAQQFTSYTETLSPDKKQELLDMNEFIETKAEQDKENLIIPEGISPLFWYDYQVNFANKFSTILSFFDNVTKLKIDSTFDTKYETLQKTLQKQKLQQELSIEEKHQINEFYKDYLDSIGERGSPERKLAHKCFGNSNKENCGFPPIRNLQKSSINYILNEQKTDTAIFAANIAKTGVQVISAVSAVAAASSTAAFGPQASYASAAATTATISKVADTAVFSLEAATDTANVGLLLFKQAHNNQEYVSTILKATRMVEDPYSQLSSNISKLNIIISKIKISQKKLSKCIIEESVMENEVETKKYDVDDFDFTKDSWSPSSVALNAFMTDPSIIDGTKTNLKDTLGQILKGYSSINEKYRDSIQIYEDYEEWKRINCEGLYSYLDSKCYTESIAGVSMIFDVIIEMIDLQEKTITAFLMENESVWSNQIMSGEYVGKLESDIWTQGNTRFAIDGKRNVRKILGTDKKGLRHELGYLSEGQDLVRRRHHFEKQKRLGDIHQEAQFSIPENFDENKLRDKIEFLHAHGIGQGISKRFEHVIAKKGSQWGLRTLSFLGGKALAKGLDKIGVKPDIVSMNKETLDKQVKILDKLIPEANRLKENIPVSRQSLILTDAVKRQMLEVSKTKLEGKKLAQSALRKVTLTEQLKLVQEGAKKLTEHLPLIVSFGISSGHELKSQASVVGEPLQTQLKTQQKSLSPEEINEYKQKQKELEYLYTIQTTKTRVEL